MGENNNERVRPFFFLAKAKTLQLFIFIFQNITTGFLLPNLHLEDFFFFFLPFASSPSFAFSSCKCPVAVSQAERSLAVKFIMNQATTFVSCTFGFTAQL